MLTPRHLKRARLCLMLIIATFSVIYGLNRGSPILSDGGNLKYAASKREVEFLQNFMALSLYKYATYVRASVTN